MGIEIKRRAYQRRIRISVKPGGHVLVTAGKQMPVFLINGFISQHQDWIERTVEKMKRVKQSILKRHDPAEYKRLKKSALKLVEERLAHFNRAYGFSWKRISIRNQKSQWGSCSKSGTLSFNYKLALIPPELADYVIVHELCHIQQMNHGSKFWALVNKTVPDFRERRRALKAL
ncbi:MAG TPA: SprT family zinc-dependent metalloprotease [Verrucomicrobiae bacterium]|nr:SprT family zinc-dependent metalloprotease [Verrucomicrobiae bacterium]